VSEKTMINRAPLTANQRVRRRSAQRLCTEAEKREKLDAARSPDPREKIVYFFVVGQRRGQGVSYFLPRVSKVAVRVSVSLTEEERARRRKYYASLGRARAAAEGGRPPVIDDAKVRKFRARREEEPEMSMLSAARILREAGGNKR
jgi:hypothetical protein